MKGASIALFVTFAVLPMASLADGTTSGMTMTPNQLTWQPVPDALPAGGMAVVLYGNPGESGPFAIRLKAPANYRVAPHSHPTAEYVTVISGTLNLGMGEVANPGKSVALPAGSVAALPADHNHYVWTQEDTVLDVHSMGPFAIKYVDPADDPRKQTAERKTE